MDDVGGWCVHSGFGLKGRELVVVRCVVGVRVPVGSARFGRLRGFAQRGGCS